MPRVHPVSAVVRRELLPGDLAAIVRQHEQVYAAEHGLDASFVAMVAEGLAEAARRGWPGPRDAVWIVERDGGHLGSLALTAEDDDEVRLRWFLLDAELRGTGTGRRLLDEALAHAADHGFSVVTLVTFGDLEAAAHLYRTTGFRLTRAETGPRWGRRKITYQHYTRDIRADADERPHHPCR